MSMTHADAERVAAVEAQGVKEEAVLGMKSEAEVGSQPPTAQSAPEPATEGESKMAKVTGVPLSALGLSTGERVEGARAIDAIECGNNTGVGGARAPPHHLF